MEPSIVDPILMDIWAVTSAEHEVRNKLNRNCVCSCYWGVGFPLCRWPGIFMPLLSLDLHIKYAVVCGALRPRESGC